MLRQKFFISLFVLLFACILLSLFLKNKDPQKTINFYSQEKIGNVDSYNSSTSEAGVESKIDESKKLGVRFINHGESDNSIETTKKIQLSNVDSVDVKANEIESRYRKALSIQGFNDYEINVIIKNVRDEILSKEKRKYTALEKSSLDLDLSTEKKALLNEAFDEVFFRSSNFDSEYVSSCLRTRLRDRSDCSNQVLEDFLTDMLPTFQNDRFTVSPELADLSISATRLLISKCGETSERAKYQFSLVMVECEPM